MPEIENKLDYWIVESVKDKNFDDLYVIQNEIGSGPIGTLLKCNPKGQQKLVVSAKVLLKNKEKRIIQREVSLLLKLSHPNVCRIRDFVETPNEIFIVSDFLSGGSVLERVSRRTKFHERAASKILLQILEGLKYIHDEGLIHGDLKPENFIYEVDNDDSLIKIADIALRPLLDKDLLKSCINTSAQYCAPEVLRNEPSNPSSDLWSLGAFAYTLLTGSEPFKTDNQADLYKKILKSEIDVDNQNYKKLSTNAKDFLVRLLTEDTKKRMNMNQALSNLWLTGKAANLKNLPCLEALQALIGKNKAKV